MFDLPDAKRIRRSDLNRSRSSSLSSDTSETAANAALLQAKLAAIYGSIEYDAPFPAPIAKESTNQYVRVTRAPEVGEREKRNRETDSALSSGSADSSDDDDDDDGQDTQEDKRALTPEDQEYEFSLFRTSTNAPATQPQTIILSSTPEPGEGRILRSRPISHFIAEKADGAKRAEWKYAAVSGESILQAREKRAWGLEVRWRVRLLRNGQLVTPSLDYRTTTTTPAKSPPSPAEDQDPSSGKKKRKPNKKRRIHLRAQARKQALADESRRKMEEVEKKISAEKEEAAKEKKMRLNREKKIKRKLKEKARKAEAAEAVVGGGSEGKVDGMEGVGVGEAMEGVEKSGVSDAESH